MPIDEETKKRILRKGAKPEEILGISSPIALDEAKKVYKKLALQVHPDKNQDDVEVATEVFKAVNNAWVKLQEKSSEKTPSEQSESKSSHATRHAPKQNQESNPHTQSSPLSEEDLKKRIKTEIGQIKDRDEFKKCLGDVSSNIKRLDTLNTPDLEITLLKVQAAKELMKIWNTGTKQDLLLRMRQANNKEQLQTFIIKIKNLRQEELKEKLREKNTELKEKLTRMKTKLEKPWYTKSLSKFLSKKSSSIPSKMKIELVKKMLELIQDYQLTDLDDAFKRGLHATFDKRGDKLKMEPFKERIKSIEVPSLKSRGG